jgi:hypothetical protein
VWTRMWVGVYLCVCIPEADMPGRGVDEHVLCIYTRTHTCTHTNTHAHTHKHAHAYTHIHTHTYTHTHTHIHTHTQLRTHKRTHAHTCAHTSINIVLEKNFYILNNFESSSGEPWKILQAVPGPPE